MATTKNYQNYIRSTVNPFNLQGNVKSVKLKAIAIRLPQNCFQYNRYYHMLKSFL